MNTMITRVRHFLTSEDGPTAVEYAVLVGLDCGGSRRICAHADQQHQYDV